MEEIQQRLAGLSFNPPAGSPNITVNIFVGGDSGPAHPETSASTGSGQLSSSASSLAPSLPPEPQAPTPLSREERSLLARRIGQWVTCALAGHRGTCSGRSENPLGSRVWVVFKDFHGNEFNPVKVFKKYSLAASLVKRGQELGDSLIIGMPSEWEAIEVVEAAEKNWPESFS